MATRRPRSSESQPPLGADDFTKINRIRPSIAQRLYDAGILTFERLGELSPDEIMGRIGKQVGLSATLIEREDWIGQARALAEASSSRTPASAEATPVQHVQVPAVEPSFLGVPELRQRYATFTFELLLGPDGEVRRTRVAHIQSTEQTEPRPKWDKTWPGWDPARMVGFIAQQANLSQGEKDAATTVAPPASAPTKPTPPEREQQVKLHELTIVPFGEDKPRSFVPRGKPFDLRLQLELKHGTTYGARPLSYTATVYAKRLGGGTAEKVGLARGTFTSAEPIIRVAGLQLPAGLYRLSADISLQLPATDSASPTEITETLHGGLVQIY